MGLAVVCVGVMGGLVPLAAEPIVVEGFLGKRTYDPEVSLKKLPYESLVERLAYEAERAKNRVPAPKDSKETWERLKTFEARLGAWPQATRAERDFERWGALESEGLARSESLKALHSKEVKEFVQRFGMGSARAIPGFEKSPRYWDMTVAAPIKLKQFPKDDDEESAGIELPAKDVDLRQAMRWPSFASLGDLHVAGERDFVAPVGYGHFKDRKNVSGFLAHHFRHEPKLPVVADAKVKELWAMERVELVSLLKHDKPQVYISEELPQMNELKKAKTRDLNAFEDAALKSVIRGEDVVAEAATNRIVMMGSIRATNQCLNCHEGSQRGDLLGTFSYVLRRDPAIKAAK